MTEPNKRERELARELVRGHLERFDMLDVVMAEPRLMSAQGDLEFAVAQTLANYREELQP